LFYKNGKSAKRLPHHVSIGEALSTNLSCAQQVKATIPSSMENTHHQFNVLDNQISHGIA
jgi:hypothetical protein